MVISNLKMVATDTLVNDFSPETGFLLLFSGLMLKFWKETRFLNPWDNLNLDYDATPLFVAI